MSENHIPDWDPTSESTLRNQLAAFDQMRNHCPVAYSDYHKWSLFRYDDVLRVLLDEKSFSNNVSVHLSVPNGMDPPQHTQYRKLVEQFFTAVRMDAFEPTCRKIARDLVSQLPRRTEFDLGKYFAQPFALKVQCAFLGWPSEMQDKLRHWMSASQAATLALDKPKLRQLALEFRELVVELLQQRRTANITFEDVTSALLQSYVDDRPLGDDEIVSVLRNWTAGEVGTIASSVGILVHFLAENRSLQQELRRDLKKLPEAIDEILRIHGPLVSNRRVATCKAEIGGRVINSGEQISLVWVSANRDDAVFENSSTFRWGREQADNLLYGAGIHVCPGAPLARLELRVLMEEFLNSTEEVTMAPDQRAEPATYPASGFSKLHVRLT